MDPYNQNQPSPTPSQPPDPDQLPPPDVDRLINMTPQQQVFGRGHRSKKPLIVIIILLVLLLGGGAAAYYYFYGGSSLLKSQPAAKPVAQKKSATIDVSNPLKTSGAYFAAIATCDLKTVRLLDADEKIRKSPDGFSKNQLTDCQTNVAPIYSGNEYKFFSLQKPAADGSVTAVFRSKSSPHNGDALITMTKTGSSWYVKAFTPQSTVVGDPAATNPADITDSTLTGRVDNLAAALEQYYDNHFGYYPTADNLADDSWIQTNLATLDTATLFSDTAKTQRINSSPHYIYEPASCDSSGSGCAGFVITVDLPSGGSYTKDSVNSAG
ncbi:MAG TPA: hypothetical protein VH144_00350 [Candidatus Saccharimonadales bacterium]|nr:hypothetical protein [Candidatus Saccharimonadales bacterium]